MIAGAAREEAGCEVQEDCNNYKRITASNDCRGFQRRGWMRGLGRLQ
jgi:hypothetical protein